MIKTNGERLNEALDEVIKQTKNEHTKILASRMRNDEDFCIGALSCFTTLCYLQPSILEKITKHILKLHLKNIGLTDD